MPDTTIPSVEAVTMRIPLNRPISSALAAYEHVDATGVWVRTHGGLTGFGFNAGLGGHAAAAIVAYLQAELIPLALGSDAADTEGTWERLWGVNKPRLRGGIGAWALSAIDIACWDIAGKVSGRSVHRMLGGSGRPVPVYGSGGWLSLDNDDLLAECAGFQELGIGGYKFKVGGDRDRERTELLRNEVGEDFSLMADANQRFEVVEAIELSRMLADHNVLWLEEPVLADSTSDLATVAEHSAVPIAADENVYYRWGFQELCDRRAARFLQPDVARCGGITEFAKVAGLAESHGLSLSSHLWHELSISLVGASPSGHSAEYAPLIPENALTRPFPIEHGAIEIPDVPGHGVELTSEFVTRFQI